MPVENIDVGEDAFPYERGSGNATNRVNRGMSMWAWYAGHALAGVNGGQATDVAANAAAVADAMMLEHQKRHP